MLRYAFLLLLLAGCVAQPTKVTETQKREFDLLVDKSSRPIELTDQTVILDARSSFDYGLNRVANSIHFPWDNLAETTASGEVLRDPRKAALRLSLNGLEPQTPVVVVGNGPHGDGGEGRLAWTLLYLGFQDVQVATAETFRKNFTQNPSPPAKNAPVWPVNPRTNLQIDKAEFAKLAQDPRGRLDSRTWIIDVRTDKEYFNKGRVKNAPDINAVHVPWSEFYTEKGRPNSKVKGRLQAVGILPADRVILISNKGVRSGAAAYALLAIGFAHVQNFTFGWNSLLTDRL
jgi:thiosulfate/3-mercaptopyruvate sulfurtransferase